MVEKEGMRMLQSIAQWMSENPVTVFLLVWLVGEVLLVGVPLLARRA